MASYKTPLARWFARNPDITQERFAAMLSEHRDVPTHQSNVSCWCTGVRPPSDPIILAVEAVTDGAVRREDWPCWRRRQARRARQAKAKAQSRAA